MNFPLLTGSKMQLAEDCPGSFALPHQRNTSAPAQRGTAKHAVLEKGLDGDVAGAIETAPAEIRAWAKEIDWDALLKLFAGKPSVERSLAYNPETGKAIDLGAGIKRDYSKLPAGWIPMTLDAVAWGLGVAVSADWKSGFAYVEHPRENPQLRIGVLAAARVSTATEGRAIVGKFDEEGDERILSADFDEMQLDAIEADVRATWLRVQASRALVTAGHEPELIVGPHCRYCPAITNCPAHIKAAQVLVENADKLVELSPKRRGELFFIAKGVAAAAEKMDEAVREFARVEPVPLPNGKELRVVQWPFEVLDPQVTLDVMTELHTDELAVKVMSVTKAAITRALGGSEKLTKIVVEEIRARDGSDRGTSPQVRESKPLPKQEAEPVETKVAS